MSNILDLIKEPLESLWNRCKNYVDQKCRDLKADILEEVGELINAALKAKADKVRNNEE